MREDTAERVRRSYEYRHRRFAVSVRRGGRTRTAIEERSENYQRLVREVLDAQRATLIKPCATPA